MSKKVFLSPGVPHPLPRGGVIVQTSSGYVQVGSPPETIKDTMHYELGVPGIFCLPSRFFLKDQAISAAEVEFPLYFNFFIKKRKTIIVCPQKDRQLFQVIIEEALFGPKEYNIEEDFSPNHTAEVPDIRAETGFFATFKTEDLVEFKTIEENKPAGLGRCLISITEQDEYLIQDRQLGFEVAVSRELHYKVDEHQAESWLPPAFKPPTLGVTCLGSSNGFDPQKNTSGFIIWINGSGVMVDPPVNSTDLLSKQNINPKLIDTLILTHTHADHDAGLLQKILQEERVTIYTTQTVMRSWLTKYAKITEAPAAVLKELFNFVPVKIGEKIKIKGGLFEFSYRLHSVPTVGFHFLFQNKTFLYSSDHLNLPSVFDELLEKKIISPTRHRELNDFNWKSDVIYHEAGIPPLHTPLSRLQALPQEVQEKVTLYHFSDEEGPKNSPLKMAKQGVEETHVILADRDRSPLEQKKFYFNVIRNMKLLGRLSAQKIQALAGLGRLETYYPGEYLIKKNQPVELFFIILSGAVLIHLDEHLPPKRYVGHQFLGEVSLLGDQLRPEVDAVAETELNLLTVSKEELATLLKGEDEVKNEIRKLALNRSKQTWEVVCALHFYKYITPKQKTDLEMLLEKEEVKEEKTLLNFDTPAEQVYLFHSGEAALKTKTKDQVVSRACTKGELLAKYEELKAGHPSTIALTAAPGALLFKIAKKKFLAYLHSNPGLLYRFFLSY